MWRRKFWKKMAGAGLLCCASIAQSDTLVLRDGQTLAGRITGETADSITIDASAGRFTFPRSQVLQTTKESNVENQQRDMERFLAQGKVDAALMIYHSTGLDQSLSDAALTHSFVQQLKSTAVGAVATSATTVELAAKFQQHDATPPELLILVAAFAMDHENYEVALSLLRNADQRIQTSLQWPPETLTDLLDRIATSAIKAQQGAILAASAALVSRLPLPQDSSSPNYLLTYAQIEELIRHGDFLRATAHFKPDLFLHRADLFVPLAEKLITSVMAAPASNTLIPALESSRVTILPYIEPELQRQAYKSLINKLFDSNRTTDAQNVADEVSAKDADLGAMLLHLVEFRRRRASLQEENPLATYKLASWAKSMGLLEEAEGLFLTLRSDPRFTETVNLQLEIIDHSQSLETVRRLRRLYDTNQIEDLKKQSAEFLQTSPPDKYEQDVRDLLQLADFEKWSHQRTSHGKAEAEYQQAERLANRGEYDEALGHLNQIQMDRADSAAARKANALRDRIMREKLRQSRKSEVKLSD